jgi:hypothetical protein
MLREEIRGPLTTAQVLGAGLVSEPAEINGSLDPVALCHLGEVSGRPALSLLEVAAPSSAHRVDEVVGHLHPLPRALQRIWIEDVTGSDLEAAIRKVAGASGVANEAADSPTTLA